MTLKTYLRVCKLSQREAAEMFGVTQAMISYLCAGKRLPSLPLSKTISTLTDGLVKPEDFEIE